jgi:hypothetical protein
LVYIDNLRSVLKRDATLKPRAVINMIMPNDWWISLMQINALHMAMSTPMKRSNLELI